MKNAFQIKALIVRRGTKKPIDLKNIRTICTDRKVPLHHIDNVNDGVPNGLTTAEFIDWFEQGFGDGEVVLYNGNPSIISCADTKKYRLAGYMTSDGEWVKKEIEDVSSSQLTKLPSEKQFAVNVALSHKGLEYNINKSCVMAKHIPKKNESVVFWNADRYGAGIVRSVNVEANEVELYCFYDYTDDKVGYSMHEKDAATFHEYHFTEMSRSTRARMNAELGKRGKVWKGRLYRIESISERAIGKSYWYITDRMKLKQGEDTNDVASRVRFNAGNYFTSIKEGMEYAEKMLDILRTRGAK